MLGAVRVDVCSLFARERCVARSCLGAAIAVPAGRRLRPACLLQWSGASSGCDPDAVIQATVTIPGGGKTTRWGSDDARDFGDYLEKAETKAIGRAFAALG
jgi:hypothetical protein